MRAATTTPMLRDRSLAHVGLMPLTWVIAPAVAAILLLVNLAYPDDTSSGGTARALTILTPIILVGLLASRGTGTLQESRLRPPLVACAAAVMLATVFTVNR